MADFFRDLIAERRRAPTDDLISHFIAARDGGEEMTEDELIAACMLVLFGGHETTTNLLTTGMLKFCKDPEARALLASRPDLAPLAVEECLRLDGPSGSMARVVAVEHELHGKRLRPGERVFAMLNAANMDPRVFDRPQAFDLTRERSRHVTFGYGAHFCLGASLARLEGEVAFARLCREFPAMRLYPDDAPDWHETIIMRGLKRLPVILD
jgi:Cytochrome P450